MKTVVVTGGNRGIGQAVARDLVSRGCRVVLHARDRERASLARDELGGAGPGEVTLVWGDLSTKRGIRETAEAILVACPRIDVLIHNAGLWPSERVLNEDGLEMAFVVNHLAPFMLNHLLEARLVESRSRVVQVSAGLYVKGRPDLEKTPTGEDFHPLGTYPTTKLCNLLLVPRFAARWKDRGPTILALHPGVIRTGLGDRKGMLGGLLRVVKRLWKSPEDGARPVVKLALDPALEGVTGKYYHLDVETELHPVARNEALAAELWAQAQKLSEAG
ncbi:SDR family NAD(P)-dependent oxidoreductase [Polyangium sp. y55x31]|uniref:SDR family NAD(P)-dependent oxidoreductase n=1 Tax=Polyangium sp. y55x31 TaxID=3042688 RepID=UPI0024821372|nr:SDR family NAD(P)-dependent oxidoreductase [Polyangium sp. y55x31]MDI1481040.1 SDR family NAD(P)-dependent oxidoreductase [Polyangium sp. y55x31]